MIDAQQAALVGLILLPLASGAAAFLLGPGRGAGLCIASQAAALFFALQLADSVLAGDIARHRIGGWGAPLGIDLTADGLAAAMLLLTQAVALPLALYARAYFRPDSAEVRYFWPLFGLLLAGLNALFVSTDLFNLYVTLELVGLAAVGLVGIGGGALQIAAALRYLFATLLGSGAYLLGVALIYGAYGSVAVASLTPLVAAEAPTLVGLAAGLMLLGLLLKTALFPCHYWLPPAHGGAAAPVSALLSALVVKASFYLILRLWLGPLAPLAASHPLLPWLPALLGAGAILWGSWQAIRAPRLKTMIAYSTVAQLGYLFLIFPLLGTPGGRAAGILHAVAHGLAKAAMFTAAGVLIKATGQDRIAALAGAAQQLPLTLFAFGLAGVTLMGLPPSAGFLAKWQLLDAALGQGYWGIVLITLSGGLLAAVYVFRVLRQAFLLTSSKTTVAPVPRTLEWTAFGLAGASLLLGLRGVELVELLAVWGWE